MNDPTTPEGRGEILAALSATMLDVDKPAGFAGLDAATQASTLALAAVAVAVSTIAAHNPDRSQLTATVVTMVDAILDSLDDAEDDT